MAIATDKNHGIVSVTVLTRGKETKSMIRYEEHGPKESQTLRSLYIRKEAVQAMGNPGAVCVTVQPEGAGTN